MSIQIFLQTFLSLLIFSFVAATIKWIDANPFTIGITRLAMASVGVFVFVLFKHPWNEFVRVSRENWKGLVGLGFLFFIHWLTYFFSIKWSSASLGILSLSTYGVLMGILAALFTTEKFYRKDLIASFFCLFGVYFLVPEFTLANRDTLGVALGLISAIFYAMIPIVHKKLKDVPFLIRMFYQFFIAFLGFLMTLPWSRWDLESKDWLGLIYLGVGATLVAHSLWSYVATRLDGKTAGLIYYSYIPFSVFISYWFLAEKLELKNIIGGIMIIGGLIFGLMGQKKSL